MKAARLPVLFASALMMPVGAAAIETTAVNPDGNAALLASQRLNTYQAIWTSALDGMRVCALTGKAFSPQDANADANGCVATSAASANVESFGNGTSNVRRDFCALNYQYLLTHRSAGLWYSCTVAYNRARGTWSVSGNDGCGMVCMGRAAATAFTDYSAIPMLVNREHTEAECRSAGGAIEGAAPNRFCSFSNSGCPSGWEPYQNRIKTAPNTCVGSSGTVGASTFPYSPGRLCGSSCTTTGDPAWSSQPAATCAYQSVETPAPTWTWPPQSSAPTCASQACSATVTHVACY